MLTSEVLNLKVSRQDYFWSKINETYLESIISEIKGDTHGSYTDFLRQFYFKGDKENYSIHKRKLPVVTFCGSFDTERTKEHLKEYNFIIVLDIDKLGVEELERIKISLTTDEHVFAFWESPSKDGIKGLVHLEYTFNINDFGIDASHKIAFNQLVDYFQENYNIELDKSGSDITRLCFISQDKNLVLKEKIKPFHVEKIIPKTSKKEKFVGHLTIRNVKSKDLLNNPSGKNNQNQRRTIKKIIKYLTKNSLSITNSYEEWLRVAFAICNSFTFDLGLTYFLELCILDKDKYNETECKNLLINCYENSKGEIGFGTIIHLANEKGFK